MKERKSANHKRAMAHLEKAGKHHEMAKMYIAKASEAKKEAKPMKKSTKK